MLRPYLKHMHLLYVHVLWLYNIIATDSVYVQNFKGYYINFEIKDICALIINFRAQHSYVLRILSFTLIMIII